MRPASAETISTRTKSIQSKKYIDRFDMISVREQSGVDILNNQYGYHNAVQIVDPTLGDAGIVLAFHRHETAG